MSGTPSVANTPIVNNLTGPAPNGLAFKGTGTVTINGATPVTITNAAYNPGDKVDFALLTVGGTVGNIPTVKTIAQGAPTVAGTASDTSTYTYFIYTVAAQV